MPLPDPPKDPRYPFFTCNTLLRDHALKYGGGIAVYFGEPDKTAPGERTTYRLINPLP
jgi:hypothetical protein